MGKLTASGQTAIRARKIRQEVRKLEAEARSATDNTEYRNIMEQAAQLKDQALDLEKTSRWFAYLDRKETVGRNQGRQQGTKDKIDFLRAVSESIGGASREAIAAECLENHPGTVRRLWRKEGEKARSSLLKFMKNHKVP